MLLIENAYIAFGNKKGLNIDGIQFDAKGITLLTGENGSGKSSLLKSIAGLTTHLRGCIRLNNQPVGLDQMRQNATYLAQKPYVFDTTVYKNLIFPIHHLTQKEQQKKIALVSEEFGVSDLLTHNARALSGGQKQRVAIARAKLTESPWMLFDEPYSGLDFASRRSLTELISSVGKEKAIILTSHEPLSDKVAITQHLTIEDQHVKRIN